MKKKHNSGAPSVRKFGYPSVREIWAVTCSHVTNLNHRLTNVKYMHVIQSTCMATQMQLETFCRQIAGPPASCEAETITYKESIKTK